MRQLVVLASLLFITACSAKPDDKDPSKKLVEFIDANKVGRDTDHWIEMKNLAGEWEKTALVFGYVGDYEECKTAAAGLKKVNYERDYRCVPANQK